MVPQTESSPPFLPPQTLQKSYLISNQSTDVTFYLLYTPETNRGFQITSFRLWHQNVIYKTIPRYVKRPWILVVNGFSHWYISLQINAFEGYSFLFKKNHIPFYYCCRKIYNLTAVENFVGFYYLCTNWRPLFTVDRDTPGPLIVRPILVRISL